MLLALLLLVVLDVTSVVAWKWQTFNQTFYFSSPALPNCNATTCCTQRVWMPAFEIIDIWQLPANAWTHSNSTPFTLLTLSSDLPEGYALTTVNISLWGSFNLSQSDSRTIMSILIGKTAIQTDYEIIDECNCHSCGCYNCHHQITIAAQDDTTSWWPGFDYQNPNILRFVVTQDAVSISKVTLHLLALDISPQIREFFPPSLPIHTSRPGLTVHGSNFLYSLRYICEFTSEKLGINETVSGYLYNATSMFCPTRFLSQILGTTEIQIRVYPDTGPLGNIDFPEAAIGPFPYLIYEEPRISGFSPLWGDPEGGTMVTIVGENFLKTSELYCKFGSESSKASWNNSSAISCVAPKMHSRSIVLVEVSENGFDWTTNNGTFVYGGPSSWWASHLWIIVVAALGFVLFLSIIILFVLYRSRDDPKKAYISVLQQIDSSALIPREELEVKEKVGRGSFGDVYRGTWRYSEVAIKAINVPSHELLSEIVREAQLMLTMRHPNITQLMGVAIDANEICIVTEFINRGSLFRILHLPNVQIEHEHVRKFALDCCKGMAYLHGSLIMHRDLKCSNLLVDKDWNIKVSDFGLSRSIADTSNTEMTACGTPCWAAPEVLRNMSYSFAADVYSFGVCLWEMLTREYPYDGRPPYQVVIAVATQGLRLEIPSTIPKHFSDIIEACWEEASNRPTFGELINTLSALVLPVPRTAHPRIKGGNARPPKPQARPLKLDQGSTSLSPAPALSLARSPYESYYSASSDEETTTTTSSPILQPQSDLALSIQAHEQPGTDPRDVEPEKQKKEPTENSQLLNSLPAKYSRPTSDSQSPRQDSRFKTF